MYTLVYFAGGISLDGKSTILALCAFGYFRHYNDLNGVQTGDDRLHFFIKFRRCVIFWIWIFTDI